MSRFLRSLVSWCAVAIFAIASTGITAAQTERRDLLDPNTASEQELLAVPNLSAPLVKAVVAGRPFTRITQLDSLLARSLGKPERAAVYEHLFLRLDLNTASDAELACIPGVGPRLVHEFKEYRPYRSMAQFRREIGKYVRDKELERLERYLMVKE